jgi:hypothetical protein
MVNDHGQFRKHQPSSHSQPADTSQIHSDRPHIRLTPIALLCFHFPDLSRSVSLQKDSRYACVQHYRVESGSNKNHTHHRGCACLPRKSRGGAANPTIRSTRRRAHPRTAVEAAFPPSRNHLCRHSTSRPGSVRPISNCFNRPASRSYQSISTINRVKFSD